MLPSSGFARLAIGTAAILAGLLVYATESNYSPAVRLPFASLLQTAIVIIAAFASFHAARNSSRHLRRLWILLASALVLYAVAQGLETYSLSLAPGAGLTLRVSDVLFFLWVAPVVMMLLPWTDGNTALIEWQEVLDFAQIAIVAFTAYLYFTHFSSRGVTDGPQTALKIIRLQVFRDAALAVAFLVRAANLSRRSVRTIFGNTVVVFFLTSASGLVLLLFSDASPARTWWTVLAWAAPFLFIAVFASTWHGEEEPTNRKAELHIRVPVLSGVLPILAPFAVLLMSRRIATEQIAVVWIAVAASFALSAARLLLTSKHQRQIVKAFIQTEQALDRAERIYHTAFRSSPDSVGIVSMPRGEFLDVNDAFTPITGYTRAEALGRTAIELGLWVDPLHRARVISRLQEEGEVREKEFQCRTKNGEIRTCQFSATLVQLDEKPCVLFIVRDITGRNQAEKSLRTSEERFRNLLQNLQVGVVQLGPEGETQFINRAALETFGLTEHDALGKKSAREEILGREGSKFKRVAIGEDEIEIPLSMRPGLRAIATKQAVHNQVVGWRRTDSYEVLWTLVDAVPYLTPAGNVASVILSVSNITERKQAEEALRASEERFRTLVREMDVGVVLSGPNEEIQFANQAATRMYEIPLEEAQGKTVAELELVPLREDGTEIPLSGRPVAFVIRTGQALKDEVVGWRRRGSGKVLWTLSSSIPLWNNTGAIAGAISTFTNITERQRAEDALRLLSKRLLQLQDEERRRLGRRLHASLAQSVLAVNLNLAQVTQSANHLPEKVLRALGEARSLLQEMSQEIRTISYLLHPPLLDELGLVSAIKEYCEGFSQRSGIGLELDLPDRFGRLPQETEMALFRVVQESLSNIQRHSGSETAKISVRDDANCIAVEVSDLGQGMGQGPIDLGRTTRVRLGVGILGMRERMTQLGGKLEIESSPSGTTVRATIPRVLEVSNASSHSYRR